MDLEITKYNLEADKALEEISSMKKRLIELKSGTIGVALQPNTNNDELNKLISENTKLKHRLSILNEAIADQSKKNSSKKSPPKKSFQLPIDDKTRLQSVTDILTSLFSVAISKAFPDIADAPVIIDLSRKFGDYQCNSVMSVVTIYKQLGKKVVPRDIAQKIIDNVPAHDIIDKMEVAGPGFINIFLNKNFAVDSLSRLFEYGVKAPTLEKKLKILVDFSAPNIAKEMHVGHLRSTIIGESIARMFEYMGHEVLRINHVGDWGTQFGMLIAHLQDKFPDFSNKSPPIGDLQAFYKESKIRFDQDDVFKKRAYECVVKLQSMEPTYKKAWQLICDVSRKEFQHIYDRLDITITERGESFYADRMKVVVQELEEGGYLTVEQGRKVMWGKHSIPLTLVKSDGGFTYDTSDVATIKQRFYEDKIDWNVYVVDSGQGMHFEVLFDCVQRCGILDPTIHRNDFIGFGVVLGEDKKKFKTRSGESVRLIDLLEEGLRRSLEKLKEKGRDKVLTPEELKKAQEAVAYGCIKYADLSHNRHHEYVFSFDKMLDDKGNTAVYLLYALTRIKSIARTANIAPEKIKELSKANSISLDHEKEWKLAKVLLRFPDVILKISKDIFLHPLCEYAYEISTTFTEFYDSCYCVEKDNSGNIVKVNIGRILLAEATARILEQCFYILGLKTVDKM